MYVQVAFSQAVEDISAELQEVRMVRPMSDLPEHKNLFTSIEPLFGEYDRRRRP